MLPLIEDSNIYNDIYGTRSSAIRLDLQYPNFQKQKKKDLDTQLVIVNLGSTKNLEVLCAEKQI